MTPTAAKWLEAGKLLAADPSRVVRCPERDDGVLRVHDEVLPSDPTRMERYLVCETCGARNVLRMRVPVTTTRIVLDPKSLRLGTKGPSTGDIYVLVGGVVFPATGWNDFVIVIAEAWIAAILRLLSGAKLERVYFMDGPYCVELKAVGERDAELRALHGGIEKGRIISRLDRLLVDAVNAAPPLVAACRELGDDSRDSRQLESTLAQARAELAKLFRTN